MMTTAEKLISDVFLITVFIVFILTAVMLPVPFLEIVGVKMNMPFCSYEHNVLEFFDLEIEGSKTIMELVATSSLILFAGSCVMAYKCMDAVCHPRIEVEKKSIG